MFILKKSHRYWWPCVALEPVDGGKFEKREFKLLFETIEEAEWKELTKEMAAAEAAGDFTRVNDHLKRAVRDWQDVEDEKKKAIPFSEDMFAEALFLPWFRIAAYEAWRDAQNGVERARKN